MYGRLVVSTLFLRIDIRKTASRGISQAARTAIKLPSFTGSSCSTRCRAIKKERGRRKKIAGLPRDEQIG